MSYRCKDSLGDTFDIQPVRLVSGPALSVAVNDTAVWIPVDQVDELIAGIHAAKAEAIGRHPRAGP